MEKNRIEAILVFQTSYLRRMNALPSMQLIKGFFNGMRQKIVLTGETLNEH